MNRFFIVGTLLVLSFNLSAFADQVDDTTTTTPTLNGERKSAPNYDDGSAFDGGDQSRNPSAVDESANPGETPHKATPNMPIDQD